MCQTGRIEPSSSRDERKIWLLLGGVAVGGSCASRAFSQRILMQGYEVCTTTRILCTVSQIKFRGLGGVTCMGKNS